MHSLLQLVGDLEILNIFDSYLAVVVVAIKKNIEVFEDNIEDNLEIEEDYKVMADSGERNEWGYWELGCWNTKDCSNSGYFDLFHTGVLKIHLNI